MRRNAFEMDWYTLDGTTIEANGAEVTPRTRLFRIRHPYGAIVWNHPDAVRITRGGNTRTAPIIDVTFMAMTALRVTTFTLLAATALLTIVTKIRKRRQAG